MTETVLKLLEDPTRSRLTVSTAVCRWTVLYRSCAQNLLGGSDEAVHGSEHCTWILEGAVLTLIAGEGSETRLTVSKELPRQC